MAKARGKLQSMVEKYDIEKLLDLEDWFNKEIEKFRAFAEAGDDSINCYYLGRMDGLVLAREYLTGARIYRKGE